MGARVRHLREHGGGGNNLILNNDVHDNEDQLALAAPPTASTLVTRGTPGNIIRGNRAWCNSDDGIDMWNAAPALIENNWVWDTGRVLTAGQQAGMGTDLSWEETVLMTAVIRYETMYRGTTK